MTNKNPILDSITNLLPYFGFAFLIWLFGLLVLLPLASTLMILESIISLIILIPISLIFFRSLKHIKQFSILAGQALFLKHNKPTDSSTPFIHEWYIFWIVVAGILFIPYIYIIHEVLGGLFIFGVIALIVFIVFINFQYIAVYILKKITGD